MVKRTLALVVAVVGALLSVRSASADTCTGCTTQTYVNDAGVPCTVRVCTGPNWPACLNEGPTGGRICAPGASVNVTRCTSAGSTTCALTCSADGSAWVPGTCTTQMINVSEQSVCRYDCPRGADGTVYGRLARFTQICTSFGTSQVELSPGMCGDAVCTRAPSCVLAPGQTRCPTPTPRPTVTPSASGCNQAPEGRCSVGPAGASCTLDTLSGASAPACPDVSRQPFPRGMVGVPNQLCAVGFPAASESASEDFPDAPRFGNVVGYRIRMNWTPSDDPPAWVMDERDWNIGRASTDIASPVTGQRVSADMPDGLGIQNVRTGMCVAHIYETSSYGKPLNAPGWPILATRQPGYQVTLVKRWQFNAEFVCRVRAREPYCTWAGTQQQTVCPDHRPDGTECTTNPTYKGCLVDWLEREVIRDEPHGALSAPDIDVAGGRVGQDTAGPTCGVISIPIIQSQSILSR